MSRVCKLSQRFGEKNPGDDLVYYNVTPMAKNSTFFAAGPALHDYVKRMTIHKMLELLVQGAWL
jgi:hypothetical protein